MENNDALKGEKKLLQDVLEILGNQNIVVEDIGRMTMKEGDIVKLPRRVLFKLEEKLSYISQCFEFAKNFQVTAFLESKGAENFGVIGVRDDREREGTNIVLVKCVILTQSPLEEIKEDHHSLFINKLKECGLVTERSPIKQDWIFVEIPVDQYDAFVAGFSGALVDSTVADIAERAQDIAKR